jgi:hypothetical protein
VASLSAIRDSLKTRLETISGLRAYDTVPGTINPPMAVVYPQPGTFLTFDTTLSRGSDDLTFLVHLFASTASDRAGQDALDSYLAGSGATSVKAAVEGQDVGEAHYMVVTEARNYGQTDYGGVTYLSVEFIVQVGV